MQNEKLTTLNVGLKRSLSNKTSLNSKYFNQVLCKRAKQNIKIDEQVLFHKLKK